MASESSHVSPFGFPGSDTGAWGAVRLLEVDPDFPVENVDGDGKGPHGLVVPSLRPPAGPWAPPDALAGALGVVVLDGVLIGVGTTFARPDVRLLGPGDILDGRTLTKPDAVWRVLVPAHLAVLETGFVHAARRYPALIVGVTRRFAQGEQEQHIRAAICAMPRVEERILALLCHFAHRWGHVTPDGFTLTLPITHELLGSLIGARRPTVSLALRELTSQGLLRRRDGVWTLPPDCSSWPASGIPRAPVDEMPSSQDPGPPGR